MPTTHTYNVCFRVTKDLRSEVTAVFPDEIWDGRGHITCYARIGQHGGCSIGWVMIDTRPAKPKEYAPLLRELRQIGYRVRVLRRFRRKKMASHLPNP